MIHKNDINKDKRGEINMFNLRNRNFLTLMDFSPKEINYFLDLARDLKRAKYAGTEQQKLKGKNIALIFEKSSTRTRCAFETAAFDQGAQVTYLGPSGSQIGNKESIASTIILRFIGASYALCQYRMTYSAVLLRQVSKTPKLRLATTNSTASNFILCFS